LATCHRMSIALSFCEYMGVTSDKPCNHHRGERAHFLDLPVTAGVS
jgi:hypothetical protein